MTDFNRQTPTFRTENVNSLLLLNNSQKDGHSKSYIDVVFKKLMENEGVVKFFIETLLEQTIEAVEVKPQEFTYTDGLAGLAVFRLDFVATIKIKAGELKKVMIAIQKARNQIALMRFRNYLAEQYKKRTLLTMQK